MSVERQQIGEVTDWRDMAACLEADPELFFPVGNTTQQAMRDIEEAKAICVGCHVSSVCLEWALETGQDHGIWGGLTEEERRTLQRKSRRRG
jgi:WhiB family redox-sensing transcriptional regulator